MKLAISRHNVHSYTLYEVSRLACFRHQAQAKDPEHVAVVSPLSLLRRLRKQFMHFVVPFFFLICHDYSRVADLNTSKVRNVTHSL